ncbi:MAG: hypothetical protein IJ341_02570 [Bacteroidales bacterium]|nr:hypothetical protein [Bacteroidales bacterium]
MKFNVVRKSTYTLEDSSVEKFKKKMLAYREDEMREDGTLLESEKFPYTIEDISDDIVHEALAETIQEVFDSPNCERYTGILFDDYFETIALDFTEVDVRDCVREAVANWMDSLSN